MMINDLSVMPTMPVGMFMGDSMLPLPDSIVAKIGKLEFVDMSELRLESWLPRKRSLLPIFDMGPVLRIVNCLHNHTHPYAHQFMAYMAITVQCHEDMKGSVGYFTTQLIYIEQQNTKTSTGQTLHCSQAYSPASKTNN